MRLQPRLQLALNGAVEVADQEAQAVLEGEGRGGQASAARAISLSSGASSMPVR